MQAVLIDDDYLAVGTHIDEKYREKIKQGAYVDFSKLIGKDRLDREEDHRLEKILKGGQPFYVPAVDRNLTPISNYHKWEQAFRVYMKIYAGANPSRVTELIQYNHIIEVASCSFPWENVYRCDKEFRIHMSLHPQRNWGIILQQAWSLYVRDIKERNQLELPG